MNDIFKFEPAVFAVENTYQILVPVNCEVLMWVKVGNECYYDDSNGILKSHVTMHKIIVPQEELDREQKYTVCCRKIIERKPYFTETENEYQTEFKFTPVTSGTVLAYHIADAHNTISEPVKAAEVFEEKYGKIDFLIMNGDIPDHSGAIENFDNIYAIASSITHGQIPIVFARGNHDTRGIYAENIADYTPVHNGNSFYTFRLGYIWGIVLDCGEDKVDSHAEYGNTICCHAFRKRETAFLKEVVKRGEFKDGEIRKKIVVVHNPFVRRMENDIFNIESEIYESWAKILREDIEPDVMICGHLHKTFVEKPGAKDALFEYPCTLVVGADIKRDETKNYFKGAGYIFTADSITVVFTSSDNEISEEYSI